MLEVSQDGAGAGDPRPTDDEYLRFDETARPAPRGCSTTGRPLAVPDARTSTEIVPGRAEHHGIASMPLRPAQPARGEVRHVLILGWNERREITPDDIGTRRARRRPGRRRLRAPGGRRAPRRGLGPGPRGRPRRPRAQRQPRPAGDPAHARPRGRARARRRDVRRLPRQRRGAARSRPPATASPRAGTACASPRRGRRGPACSRPASRSSPTTTSATSPSPTTR